MDTIPERLATALADRYRLVRPLGEGGMATVFLADDLRHGRQVALKLLKPELAARIGADRFIQEIRTTAGLQHPHILPLFDSGSVDGFLYYVMPYIPGETLRARLERERQLPIDEALRLARDVAEALDYAHRQGIIHRDIKPENILLQDGRPVVADFGIALALSAATQGRMTETGLSLGTPHYMSPEQATAEKDIGPRSDVYAIACVLYEMLAGVPPHHGGSSQQVIMKILTEEPASVASLRKAVPTHVADALATALEKLPADRFASAKAFAEALGNAAYRRATGAPQQTGAKARRMPIVAVVTMTAAVAVLATIFWRPSDRQRGRTESAPIIRLAVPTAPLSPLWIIAGRTMVVSPDGGMLVFSTADSSGQHALYARGLEELDPHKVRGTEGALFPSFSWDGRWIYFMSGREVRRVSRDGSTVERLTSLQGFFGMTGTKLGMLAAANGQLVLIDYESGVVSPALKGKRLSGFRPQVLSDGETVLSSSTSGGADARFLALNLASGDTATTSATGTTVLGDASNRLVYVRADGSIRSVAFDLNTMRTSGTERRHESELVATRATSGPKVSLSANGTLVYLRGAPSVQVVDVDRSGASRPLSIPPGMLNNLRLSPDGRQFAVDITASDQRRSVWIFDPRSGAGRPLNRDADLEDRPEWTPDGRQVLFRTLRGDRTSIWSKSIASGDSATLLLSSPGKAVWEAIFTPDSKALIYRTGSQGDADIWYRLAGDTLERPLVNTSAFEVAMRPSPDGRWLAFQSNESGVDEVYVQPFPGPGVRVPVSVGGGITPVWSPSGREIFYYSGKRFVAASVSAPVSGEALTISARTVLFTGDFFSGTGHATFDVSRDGSRFLMLKPAPGEGERIVLALNWIQKVSRDSAVSNR